ncbi:MAG: CDP-diacylglycerol--serine O-phosphatidyltransferase [Candidatus Omnitrophica bacterium]|nr:CDP-diacylglycerol--serine O-phosphatidyltransferase [Candidatus Omnitrophota bacterium]MDD5592249.1 CDP-diacylglycerol--serine O-phosphatidyltransferase [Candidatus Omnitrophota bacterium]
MNLLANSLTFLSLACGFLSVIFSLEAHFTFAAWAIILSVIFDGLDGQVARRNSIPSAFGKELDSLVDVVSFGIAPALLGYIFICRHFYFWATAALFIYLCSSVMRLAKYNITAKEKMVNYFYGLPTTVSGGILASFILIYIKGKDISPLPQYVPVVFLLLVLLLAFLMVSRVRYLNLDGLKQLLGKQVRFTVLILFILLILIAFSKKAGVGIFTLFLIYLLFSPFVVKRLNSTQPR